MATKKEQTDKPGREVEAHIAIQTSGYNMFLAIPARLASEVLPYIRLLEYNYTDGYSVAKDAPDIKVLDSAKMTAIEVKSLLTGENHERT